MWLLGQYSLYPIAVSPQRKSLCDKVEKIKDFSSNYGEESAPGDIAGAHRSLGVCFVVLL